MGASDEEHSYHWWDDSVYGRLPGFDGTELGELVARHGQFLIFALCLKPHIVDKIIEMNGAMLNRQDAGSPLSQLPPESRERWLRGMNDRERWTRLGLCKVYLTTDGGELDFIPLVPAGRFGRLLVRRHDVDSLRKNAIHWLGELRKSIVAAQDELARSPESHFAERIREGVAMREGQFRAVEDALRELGPLEIEEDKEDGWIFY